MYLGQNKNIDEEEEQDKNSGGEEIQRNIDVIGPLSKLWHALESATTAPDDEVDLTNLLNLVQKTMLLVWQTNNTISYNIVGGLALAGAIVW